MKPEPRKTELEGMTFSELVKIMDKYHLDLPMAYARKAREVAIDLILEYESED